MLPLHGKTTTMFIFTIVAIICISLGSKYMKKFTLAPGESRYFGLSGSLGRFWGSRLQLLFMCNGFLVFKARVA